MSPGSQMWMLWCRYIYRGWAAVICWSPSGMVSIYSKRDFFDMGVATTFIYGQTYFFFLLYVKLTWFLHKIVKYNPRGYQYQQQCFTSINLPCSLPATVAEMLEFRGKGRSPGNPWLMSATLCTPGEAGEARDCRIQPTVLTVYREVIILPDLNRSIKFGKPEKTKMGISGSI